MNRIVEFELAGKKYPLNFSVKAARIVDEEFGSLDNVSGVFGWKDITNSLYNVSRLLQILMEQGAEYNRLVSGEKVDTPSADEIEVLIGAPDLKRAQTAIFEAIGIGSATTVEVEPEKNVKATQNE